MLRAPVGAMTMLRAPVGAMTIRRLTSTATVADLEASGSLLRISRANPRATESPLVVHSEMEIGEAAMHLAANSLTFAMVADGPPSLIKWDQGRLFVYDPYVPRPRGDSAQPRRDVSRFSEEERSN